jgi:hypothetical protein
MQPPNSFAYLESTNDTIDMYPGMTTSQALQIL